MKKLVIVAIATVALSACVSNNVSTAERKLQLIDSIIDSHADDGVCDQLVDELNEVGYYNK